MTTLISVLIGGLVTGIVQLAKRFNLTTSPKTIVVALSFIGGVVALFISPEQWNIITASASTIALSATAIYEYLKPFIKND